MTPNESVQTIAMKRYGISITDDEAHFILWEMTAFPCCTVRTWVRQVREYLKDKHGKE